MAFVLDASTTLAWHFKDEVTDRVRAIARRAFASSVAVPQHWYLEVVSALVRGERRERTSRDVTAAFLAQLGELSTEVHPTDEGVLREEVLPLARAHRLSVYDAVYLELARRLQLPIATLDAPLGAAARKLGIELIEGSEG
jgi:predicted nucleic acid-binding protein